MLCSVVCIAVDNLTDFAVQMQQSLVANLNNQRYTEALLMTDQSQTTGPSALDSCDFNSLLGSYNYRLDRSFESRPAQSFVARIAQNFSRQSGVR